MSIIQRAATALVVAGACVAGVSAQDSPFRSGPAPTSPAAASRGVVRTQGPSFRRSVVHHNPYPYPNYYQNDETAGFRNPGGTGRYREYYPPGNQFQVNQERDPVKVAQFDQGGGAPDRAEQLQAEALGIAKYNAIQRHIDNYAQPYFGYGYGVGIFGGLY